MPTPVGPPCFVASRVVISGPVKNMIGSTRFASFATRILLGRTVSVVVNGIGGGKFTDSESLAGAVRDTWPGMFANLLRPLVVCTGGEPLLQLDEALADSFHDAGFEIAVETNGTKVPPKGIDWICVSPKASAALKIRSGNELKFVYPQVGISPEEFEALDFAHFFLQPMDGPDRLQNTRLAIEFCLANPKWRLSLQTHKIVGIP